MLSALFQPQISTLESQIAQLQAQIALRQERISHLNEAESVADGAITALQTAVEKISILSPEAIASLKASVLSLFGGDDTPGGGNDGDNLPGSDNGGSNPNEPDSDPSSTAQNSELSDPPVADENSYAEMVHVSDTAAYMRKFNGEILSTYLGFSNKNKAQTWGAWCVQHGIAAGFEVRAAKRLTSFKYESKLWGASLKEIERLAECDLTQYPLKANLEVVTQPDETEQPVAQAELEQYVEQQADAIAPKHTLIDPLDVPKGCFLERSEDWISVEFYVRAHLITRIKGVPTPQIKTLGRLIETDRGIAAYANQSSIARYFPSTETAIRYLVKVANTSLNEIAAAFATQEQLREKSTAIAS